MPAVNPKILSWARETAGLSLEEAAKGLGLSSAERLHGFETGVETPSRGLLVKMSARYRRALLTFYLSEPPKRGERGEDFRTVTPDSSIVDEGRVEALTRDIRTRQELVRATLEDDEETQPLRFVASMSMKDGVEKVVEAMRDTLGLSLDQFRAQRSSDEAFTLLRQRAEEIGVFVLLIGNLGSFHTAIPVEVFRGFAIADPIAPFVVINDEDARQAWSFTLLHELAHLWIGAGGVSGSWAEIATEKFCNDVASQFLLPRSELKDVPALDFDDLDNAIAALASFAGTRRISRSMLAYNLYRADLISFETWRSVETRLRELWRSEKAGVKAKRKEDEGEGGPDYYVVRRHRIGTALLAFANRAMASGTLSPVKAARILGVRPRNVYPLLGGLAVSREGR